MNRDDLVYEVTSTTLGNSFSLRPCAKSTELILGVIGRALVLFSSVRIHALNPISNHITALISAGVPEEIGGFVGYIKNNISRELRRLHGLKHSVFAGKRAKILPISPDLESQEHRFRYVMSQGTKEDLVETPRHWPGVTGVHALEKGQRLFGTWFDRTAECEARARGQSFDEYEFATTYEVKLSPLPGWAGRTEEAWRSRVTEIVDEIIDENQKRRKRDKTSVLGAEAVMAMAPTHWPEDYDTSPSPIVLAATKTAYDALRRFYAKFCKLFWEASERLRQNPEADPQFPPCSYPPARPMTPGPALALELDFAFALD